MNEEGQILELKHDHGEKFSRLFKAGMFLSFHSWETKYIHYIVMNIRNLSWNPLQKIKHFTQKSLIKATWMTQNTKVLIYEMSHGSLLCFIWEIWMKHYWFLLLCGDDKIVHLNYLFNPLGRRFKKMRPNNSIQSLLRKDYVTIFWLKTQHEIHPSSSASKQCKFETKIHPHLQLISSHTPNTLPSPNPSRALALTPHPPPEAGSIYMYCMSN